MTRTAKVAGVLDELDAMDRSQLVKRWEQKLKRPVPKSASRIFLLRALAYELQLRTLPGLLKADEAVLSHSIAVTNTEGLRAPADPASAPPLPKSRPKVALVPGSRLVREWNGKTYTVSVIEEGFIYQNRTWSSLSAIATDITGTRWSGPKFFGLHDKPSMTASPLVNAAVS